jgi:hypothetical protein
MYFDKEAAVEVGEIVFEGENKEPMAKAGFSNPTVPSDNITSVPSVGIVRMIFSIVHTQISS